MVDLHKLALDGNVEGVRKYLQKSSSKVGKANRDGQTALHCCAEGGHVEVCRDLLTAGAFPDTEDKRGQTPLYVAVKNNKVGVATVLCEAGASTGRAGPRGCTPLHIAASIGLVECAKVLLKHGAPIDNNPDQYGNTPEDSCIIADIRIFITTARRERAAAAAAAITECSYIAVSASAPPILDGEYKDGGIGPDEAYCENFQQGKAGEGTMGPSSPYNPGIIPPSYNEIVSLSQYTSPEHGGGSDVVMSPMSRARQAAELGVDRCSGCHVAERSRQLTPCYHVVCNNCARRCREDGEDRCPTCLGQVFDDNLWIP